MRIYNTLLSAFREVERDLWEMGIKVHPQTMQNKQIAQDDDFMTKEVRGYGFKLSNFVLNEQSIGEAIRYVVRDVYDSFLKIDHIFAYIEAEFLDRVSGVPMNPGNSYDKRPEVWGDFLVDDQFHYTYSERIAPQLNRILMELRDRPSTRQAIINVHSNIKPSITLDNYTNTRIVSASADMYWMGGVGRIPCSMYYQFMIREGKLDMIYTMRSCDYITHFSIDVVLALKIQAWFAEKLGIEVGSFTYFTGSLHAYHKDLKNRGIF